jgi:hypothetical protein
MDMRMVLVAGLLMIALLGAVLSSVGGSHPLWVSAPDGEDGPPAREISDSSVPASRLIGDV